MNGKTWGARLGEEANLESPACGSSLPGIIVLRLFSSVKIAS